MARGARLAGDMELYEYSIIHKILLREDWDLDRVIYYNEVKYNRMELETKLKQL